MSLQDLVIMAVGMILTGAGGYLLGNVFVNWYGHRRWHRHWHAKECGCEGCERWSKDHGRIL